MATAMKSAAGRKQEKARTGPGYRLAEYLNANLDSKAPYTNEELAEKLGYKSPNLISMWRTGKTKVPLEQIPKLAEIMKVDFITLFRLWMDQYIYPKDGIANAALKPVENALKRLCTANEWNLLRAIRKGNPSDDPEWTEAQQNAFVQIAGNAKFAEMVMEHAKKEGMIKDYEAGEALAS